MIDYRTPNQQHGRDHPGREVAERSIGAIGSRTEAIRISPRATSDSKRSTQRDTPPRPPVDSDSARTGRLAGGRWSAMSPVLTRRGTGTETVAQWRERESGMGRAEA